jgi:hypothetical protein
MLSNEYYRGILVLNVTRAIDAAFGPTRQLTSKRFWRVALAAAASFIALCATFGPSPNPLSCRVGVAPIVGHCPATMK